MFHTLILVKQPVLQVKVDKPVPEWRTIPDLDAATVMEIDDGAKRTS